jgi:SH3-like domain-containing protein
MYKRLLMICLSVIIFTGCAGKAPLTEPPEATPQSEATLPATAVPPEPTVAPTSTIPPTSAPAPFDAVVTVATLNLRSGPSQLHDIIKLYQKDEIVSVIGHAPGLEWVKVITKDGKTGWMFATFMDLSQPIIDSVEMPISESLVALGKVMDANGMGVPGIEVGLTYVGGVERVRITGTTMMDGTFFTYAPIEFQGAWISTIIGVGCTSPIVDVNCRYNGKFTPLAGINVNLPQDVEINFVYE